VPSLLLLVGISLGLLAACACAGKAGDGSGILGPDGGVDASAEAGSAVSASCSEVNSAGTCDMDTDCAAPFLACVQLADCSRWCTTGGDADHCNTDEHCLDGRVCRILPQQLAGSCMEPGTLGAPCSSGDGQVQCEGSFGCVAVAPDLALCSSGFLGHPCGAAIDCNSGFCVQFSCTSGAPGATCTEADDCEEGYCAPLKRLFPYGAPPLICTSGADGDSCATDGQCLNGSCQPRPSGFGERADTWGNCDDGAFCADDSECSSGTCTQAAVVWGACGGLGQVGLLCVEGDDCLGGICVNPHMDSYGTCSDGALGSPCAADMDCDSGICFNDPDNGECSTGETAANCVEDADCQSAHCMLIPGQDSASTCQP